MPPSRTPASSADQRPAFWLIAGPNGSGKSTAYSDARFSAAGRSIWIINPDLLAKRIAEVEAIEYGLANLEAVRRIEAWIEASIKTHQTIGVETVLSTDKYRRLVLLARKLKFEVRLMYVILERPELNVERVRARVAAGGHTVPEDKIVERYKKSLEQMPWFVEHSDRASIFDNSGDQPRLVAEKVGSTLQVEVDAPEVILKAFPG